MKPLPDNYSLDDLMAVDADEVSEAKQDAAFIAEEKVRRAAKARIVRQTLDRRLRNYHTR